MVKLRITCLREDVVPGQREIDVDSSEVVGEESFSFNYEQPDVAVPEGDPVVGKAF